MEHYDSELAVDLFFLLNIICKAGSEHLTLCFDPLNNLVNIFLLVDIADFEYCKEDIFVFLLLYFRFLVSMFRIFSSFVMGFCRDL